MHGVARMVVRMALWLAICLCAACTPTRTSIKPPFVVEGRTYSEAGLRKLALERCRTPDSPALPTYPFTTDGCSAWPDGTWRDCCIQHDLKYWCGVAGGRRDADRELRSCVAAAGGKTEADLMYAGVRLGGAWWLPFPWRWGYGFSWPHRPLP